MLKVVHVSPRVQARGGIESLHALHRQWSIDQAFVALFDRQPSAVRNYHSLDCTWRTPLAAMRARFAAVLARYPDSVVVYHNGWGLPLFHDLDRAARRVVFLHADPAYHAPELPGFRGLLDGAIGVTPALATAWTGPVPELTPDRAVIVRAPIEPPAFVAAGRPSRQAPVIGLAGRIERAQKRLDRLPQFAERLQRAWPEARIEVVGDGALRSALERQLGGAVRFHGWVPKDEYWRVLASWDAIVFLTEHEGGPIALFEGMAVGAIPFYPAITGSWGDVYAPQVDARCYYPPGDLSALAENIRGVFASPTEQIAALRAKARAIVAPHSTADYEAQCVGLLREIAGKPRLSRRGRRPGRITDALPLGFATRWFPRALRR